MCTLTQQLHPHLQLTAICRAAKCSALHALACMAWHPGVLKDVLSPGDHIWFQERFQEAATKRYGRLQAACNDVIGSGAPVACLAHALYTGNCNQQACCSLGTSHISFYDCYA